MKRKTYQTGKKWLCGILGCLVLLSVIGLLPACKKKNGGDSTDTTAPSNIEPKHDELQEYLDSVPKQNFDYTIRIATSNQVNSMEILQAPSVENEGDIINDALFTRNAIIEEKLGVYIEYKMFGSDPYELLSTTRNSISTGTDDYDVIIGDMYNVAQGLSKGGLLIPMNQVPGVDLSKPWWNKSATNDLSINGKVYFATGDITPRYVLSPYIMLFNKQLFDDLRMDYPYEMVQDGTWTIEAMLKMIQDNYQDVTQDGPTLDDRYGLACDSTAAYAFFRGCDMKLVNLNSDGKPIANDQMTLLDTVTSYLGRVLGGNENVFIATASYDQDAIFKEGRSLFIGFTLTDIYLFNDMEDPYGILPMPKYNEDQEYCSYGQPWGAVSVLVPISCTHVEEVGTIIESMAAVSKYTSTVAALDKTLKLRKSHDAESGEMLDIIFDTLSYDLGTIFRWGGVYTDLLDSIRLNEVFLTKYSGKKDAVNAQINALLNNPAFKKDE